jgi:hypothetical protein
VAWLVYGVAFSDGELGGGVRTARAAAAGAGGEALIFALPLAAPPLRFRLLGDRFGVKTAGAISIRRKRASQPSASKTRTAF